MMMGEIDNDGGLLYSEGPKESRGFAQFLYVTYAFLVVILLSNVLIAIVSPGF